MISQAKTGYTGAQLKAELAKPDTDEKPLIQELLYAGETTFLTADPAVGKSTLATQIALCLTAGLPVFDVFEVARPVTVYYIALETRWSRQVRQIRKMCSKLEPNLENFHWNDPVGLDLSAQPRPGHPSDIDGLISVILKTWKQPGVVILDPLYLTVGKDLKDGESARALSCFMNRLMNETGAGCLSLHHSHRERISIKGDKIIEDDPIYGSRWLQAHMAVGWVIKSTASGGTHWRCTKDRFKQSRKEFTLQFDPLTQLSSGAETHLATASSKLQTLFASEPVGACFSYEQLANRLSFSVNHLKMVMHRDAVIKKFAEYIDNGPGKPALWRVLAKNGQPKPAADFSTMESVDA